jgi:hypothetical protein
MKGSIYIALLLLLAAGCSKPKPGAETPADKGVYITCEGNYTFGNAEVSFYNPVTQSVSDNLFKTVNGYSLGDVAQSMFIKDSLGFIVVNNSQKVEVVKLPSLQKVRTITLPGSSPRYVQPINDSLVYITDIYAGCVYVVNYQTGVPVKNITGMATWTEHIIAGNGFVLVEERNLDAHPSPTCSVVRLNTANHTIQQRYIFNGSNLNGIAKDVEGHIWLAVSQDSVHNIPPALYCLNGDMSTAKVVALPYGSNPVSLTINGAGSAVYYMCNGVYRLPVSDTVAPAAPVVSAAGRNLYALGIDPQTEEIYVSDALDFVQASHIYRYNRGGQLIHHFTAGIISGNFAFRYE